MKNITPLIVLLLFFCFLACGTSSSSQPQKSQESKAKESAIEFPLYAYKSFLGTINGNLNISCFLTRKDTALWGYYYYHSQTKPIFLQGNINSQNEMEVKEYVKAMGKDGPVLKETGSFKGKWENGTWKGTWKNAQKQFPFELKESTPPGSVALSADFKEKTYTEPNAGSCHVSFFVLKVEKCENESAKTMINEDLYKQWATTETEGTSSHPPKTLDEAIDRHIKDCKTEIKNMEEEIKNNEYMGMSMTSEFEQGFSVAMNEYNILAIEGFTYFYAGGAHGGGNLTSHNYDLRTGKKLAMKDIFNAGYEKQLNSIGEKYFRIQNNLSPQESLTDAGYYFEEGFALNDNFGIKLDGIHFQYNQYEVAAYAVGTPSVIIPYSEIKALIRKDCVLYGLMEKIAGTPPPKKNTDYIINE